MWTLAEGIELVRALQEKSRDFGYHVAIGGSCVNVGRSDKDVDIYFLPLDNSDSQTNPDGVKAWLDELWGSGFAIGAPLWSDATTKRIAKKMAKRGLAYSGAKTYTHKLKYSRQSGDRIDVFII